MAGTGQVQFHQLDRAFSLHCGYCWQHVDVTIRDVCNGKVQGDCPICGHYVYGALPGAYEDDLARRS